MGIPDDNQIDAILARTNALLGQVPQQLALRQQAAAQLPALPAQTNFGRDLLNSALNQGSFNTLNLPHGNGVGSVLGTGLGGLANAATVVGLLGLTPVAPEVTVPAGLGLAGLLGGASQEARTQYNQSGAITNPGAVLGQGAIEGALNLIPGSKAASLGRRLLTDTLVQGGAGAAGDVASQLMRGQPYNFGETGNAGAMGAGMGVVNALLGGPHHVPDAPSPIPQVHQLPGQRVAGLLPAPSALDHGFTGTPQSHPLALPGAPKLLTTGADPMATAHNLLTGTETPLLTGRRVVTTADGRSTFEVEPTPQPGAASPQRLAGDGGVLLKQGTPSITDLESTPIVHDGIVHQGEVVPSGPQINEHGFVAPESINSPVAQTFKNRSSAIRGAKNLGLDKAEIQPVQTGPGEWMIHKVETPKATPEPVVGEVTPAPVETPVVPEVPAVGNPQPVAPTAPQGKQEVVSLYRGVVDGRSNTPDQDTFWSPRREVADAYANGNGNAKVLNQELTFNNLFDSQNWMTAKRELGLPMSTSMPDLLKAAREMGYDGMSFNGAHGKEYIKFGKTIEAPAKPASVVKALQGLDPAAQKTVHDFDLSNVEPGTKVEGLGTFKGMDADGLPIISRKGGKGRPGESGVAYDEPSLALMLKNAGDFIQPDEASALQKIMQDSQAGQAVQFTGQPKVGRSSKLSDSANIAGLDTVTHDRVISFELRPMEGGQKLVANVINSNGKPAIRILKQAGDEALGFKQTATLPALPEHYPATIDAAKRELASTTQVQQAGIVRQKAKGTKYESHPIVQRIDESLRSDKVEDLQKALRDFDRLPPEMQKDLGFESGCYK